MINLRSDTFTQPTKEMREHMACAPVGDDAYGEDPSVNALQERCKELFGKEDALFVTSGMMANRLSYLAQTNPGDEVITGYAYHVNCFDSAPMCAFAGVVMNTLHPKNGIITPCDILDALYTKQRYEYFAQPKVISIENSINGLSGKIFPFETQKELYELAKQKGLNLHLDGARLWNAHVATGIPLSEYAKYTDTLSVCFAKGLGAPYGSMLMGPKDVIQKARRFRLWLGGGVHQVGMLAAGAHYSLRHIPSLQNDHEHAKLFADTLEERGYVYCDSEKIETNIVQFSLYEPNPNFYEECEKEGLLLFPWLPNTYRAVFHRDIQRQDVEKAVSIISKCEALCP